MAAIWTPGSDKATGLVVSASLWNDYLGADGSLDYLKNFKKDKELWVPVGHSVSGGAVSALMERMGAAVAVCTALDDMGSCGFRCPSDFTAVSEAKMLVWPRVTDAAANWDITLAYASIGELYTAHSNTDTASTYDVTEWTLFAVDFSSLFTGVAAGDLVGVKLKLADADDDVEIIGFYMKYD